MNIMTVLQNIHYSGAKAQLTGILRKSFNRYSTSPSFDLKTELEKFNSTYSIMKNNLTQRVKFDQVGQHFGTLLDYQVPYGRQTRAKIILSVCNTINPDLNREDDAPLSLVHILGWIVELFQSATLLVDDVIDNAKTRRNKKPWHIGRERYVGTDFGLLQNSCSILLMDHFEKMSYYPTLMRLLQERSAFEVCVVESYDEFIPNLIRTKNISTATYRKYTIEKGLYSVEVPFKMAACLAKNESIEFDDGTNEALCEISYVMQLMNDGLSISKDVETGKLVNEDIQEGKLTWLVTHVLENATEKDANIIAQNYGKSSEQNVKNVLKVYEKFDLQSEYSKHEKACLASITKKMSKIRDPKIKQALEKVYGIIMNYRDVNPSNLKI